MLGLTTVSTFLKYEQIAKQLIADAEAAGAAAEVSDLLARIQTAKTDCDVLIVDFKVVAEGIQHPSDILGNASKIAALEAAAKKLESEGRTVFQDLQAVASRIGADFDAIVKEVQPILDEAKK